MPLGQALNKLTNYFCNCDYFFQFIDDIKEVSLLLVDMLDNFYICKTKFNISFGRNGIKVISILSSTNIVKVEIDSNDMIREVPTNA